jgi:peptide/nickel transport system substrate-binding protein
VITHLTQARLVRINRLTDQVEPWLAESWTVSNDGRTYTLRLRSGITFSDGTPFSTADVLFAFRAVYDDTTRSHIGPSLQVAGKQLTVRALGPRDVEITFPAPFGPGVRILDNLPILPRHKLERALNEGVLAKTWGPATPASEIVGLGPFVLTEYKPGERLIFSRNPHYWRKAADGGRLPYLDELILEVVPSQSAELLLLQSGQIDITHSEIRAEDYSSVRSAERKGHMRMFELGPGIDAAALWFNLMPHEGEPTKDWLRTNEFRKAISLAVDRRAFCDVVFLGAAEPVHGPITPGNSTWFLPDLPGGSHDPERARAVLAELGLADRNADGILDDRNGRAVRFTILVQSGVAAVERGAAFVREELRKVGVGVDIVGLESGAIASRWENGAFDAIYQRLLQTDTDPASNLDFWLSSGSSHVWAPAQKQPATDWERKIDQLMHKQVGTSDQGERVRLFAEVQRIFADHMPALYFAAPHQYVATSTRVLDATPSRLWPPLLWNPDVLAVAAESSRRH